MTGWPSSGHQPMNGPQERRQGLSGSGGCGNEEMVSRCDLGPGLFLHVGGTTDVLLKPFDDQGVKLRKAVFYLHKFILKSGNVPVKDDCRPVLALGQENIGWRFPVAETDPVSSLLKFFPPLPLLPLLGYFPRQNTLSPPFTGRICLDIMGNEGRLPIDPDFTECS
jgi:hypothetical protein